MSTTCMIKRLTDAGELIGSAVAQGLNFLRSYLSSLTQDIFRRIVGRMLEQYVTVLLVLSGVSMITYLVFIADIQHQEGNALLVKMSTEQGKIVQGINLLLTQKSYISDTNELRKLDGKILVSMNQLDELHTSLREGDRYIKEGDRLMRVSGGMSEDLQLIYFDNNKPLESLMRDYTSAVRAIQRMPANELRIDSPEFHKLLS